MLAAAANRRSPLPESSGASVVIGMFAKYIVRGVAMAVTETLLTSGDKIIKEAKKK